jgi:predicted Fe-S protein YdhL (DUF1289 family)
METQKIIWHEITDSQKAEVLKRVKAYLRKQKAESKLERTL